VNWFGRFVRRSQLDEQLERELRFHIEEDAAARIADGESPEEAYRRARLELARNDLGGPAQVKEQCRDARGTRWLEDLIQDARYALRTLRQRPGFTAVALITLGLGIGATTVMFTVIDGVLLKPFGYRDPDRLLRLREQTDWSTSLGNLWGFTYPNYLDCKRESQSLDIAVWSINRGTVSAPGVPEYINGLEVSSDLLPMLGVTAYQGRMFSSEDDQRAAMPVAIISQSLWQRHFGGNPAAVGSQLLFDGRSYTVIGILPQGFRLEDDEFDVFTPIGQNASPRMRNRQAHGFGVWARLRPGATLSQARAELAVVGRRLAEQYPVSNKGRTFIAEPLRPEVGQTRSTLWLLLGAVSLVLLIACANVASLLLVRAVSRERELAMRVALGAGRGRLARQGLTESAVLSLAGGIVGILLAAIGIRPFIALWPGGLPRAHEIALNWHVLFFATGVSLGTGLLFGLAPALRAAARELEKTLRGNARTLTGGRHLHRVFVISEVALAVILLVSAGILGRTLLRLSILDPGVHVRNVLTARIALSPTILADPGRTRVVWDRLLEQARTVPGVEAIAMVDTVPMREGYNPVYYSLTAADAAQPFANEEKRPVVMINSVTPDYLKVTGIALGRGRFFTEQDRNGTESVAVIDDVMAHQAFPGEDPIGKHIWIGLGADPVTVIGIAGHVRQWGLAADDQASVRAQLYYPFSQVPDRLVRRWSELMSIAVRTSVDPLTIVEPLRREVRSGGGEVLYQVNTLEELASASLARQRFLLLVFGVFAGLALLLACIGIYGVVSYLTSQRIPEIGVRIALGADASSVRWLVLRQGLGMTVSGVVLGSVAALAASYSLAHLVEGVQSSEPLAFGIMVSALSGAAWLASYVPARRASRIDPIEALRRE
jgi:predicted permease